MSNNVPKLRFPGFNGEWVGVKLGEISSISKSSGLSKADLSENGNPCILYGELYTTYGEVIDRIKSKTEKDVPNISKSEMGDVIIPSSGETPEDIATASCVLVPDVMYGGDLNILKVKPNDGRFLSYQLNHKRRFDIAALAQGATVSHLYGKSLEKLYVKLPDIQEQSIIADFLSTIDSRITNQSSKLDSLQELKKGVLQKIFSQEIRFKREDGGEYPEWEDVSIKDILKIRHGRSQKSVEDENGLYPILGTGGLMAYANDYLYDKPSVLIGRKGTIDKPQYMETPFWTVDTLFYSEIFSGTHPKFVYYLFQTINWKNYNEASGVPSLSASTISSIEISCPSEPEQQKIAEFLSTLDSKIDLESQILSTLQTLKKGLLQQMFV